MTLVLNPDGTAVGFGVVKFTAHVFFVDDFLDLLKVPDSINSRVYYNSSIGRLVAVDISYIDKPSYLGWVRNRLVDAFVGRAKMDFVAKPFPFSLILNSLYVFKIMDTGRWYLFDVRKKFLFAGALEEVEAYLKTEGHNKGVDCGCVNHFQGIGALDVVALVNKIIF